MSETTSDVTSPRVPRWATGLRQTHEADLIVARDRLRVLADREDLTDDERDALDCATVALDALRYTRQYVGDPFLAWADGALDAERWRGRPYIEAVRTEFAEMQAALGRTFAGRGALSDRPAHGVG